MGIENSAHPAQSEQQPNNGAPAATVADLTAIAAGMATDMPDVQEHAVQQAEKDAQTAQSVTTDKNGATFDPALHATGTDGQPVMTVRGTFALKRGRKATGAAPTAPAQRTSTLATSAPLSPAAQQQAATDQQARAAGVAAAEMLFMLGQAIGGEEWTPRADTKIGLDERAMMHQAFSQYFVATGKTDVPPGAALAFCVVAYAAPRFGMPKTQSRFQRAKAWVAQWWVNRKLRKQGLEAAVTAKRDEK